MVLVPLLVVPLKAAVARPGPPGMAGDGYYPSGHTATATVAYGAAALLLLPLLRGAYGRRALLVGCAALNVGVGFGLVRRGYHWPLDVVASWLLLAMLLQVMAWVIARYGTASTGVPDQPK
jgi:undecaprenyl-diphosphatase